MLKGTKGRRAAMSKRGTKKTKTKKTTMKNPTEVLAKHVAGSIEALKAGAKMADLPATKTLTKLLGPAPKEARALLALLDEVYATSENDGPMASSDVARSIDQIKSFITGGAPTSNVTAYDFKSVRAQPDVAEIVSAVAPLMGLLEPALRAQQEAHEATAAANFADIISVTDQLIVEGEDEETITKAKEARGLALDEILATLRSRKFGRGLQAGAVVTPSAQGGEIVDGEAFFAELRKAREQEHKASDKLEDALDAIAKQQEPLTAEQEAALQAAAERATTSRTVDEDFHPL